MPHVQVVGPVLLPAWKLLTLSAYFFWKSDFKKCQSLGVNITVFSKAESSITVYDICTYSSLIRQILKSKELCPSYSPGSIKLNWLQSYYVSRNGELTLWSSMEMEDIQILATYNATRQFIFKKSWAKGNHTEDYWSLYNIFLSKYFSAFQIHMNGIKKEFRAKGKWFAWKQVAEYVERKHETV